MTIALEWDNTKVATNPNKHGVSFDEASTVFYDALAVIFDDVAHSRNEKREIIIGYSSSHRLLLVSFTERETAIKIMKKTGITEIEESDDLAPEYRFDYSKAQPNRFAGELKPGTRVVLLDPDIAEVFTTQEDVNAMLRAVIKNMPRRTSIAGKVDSIQN